MQNDFMYIRGAQAIREDAKIVTVSSKRLVPRGNRKIIVPFDFVCPTTSDFMAKVLAYIEELSKANVLGMTLFFWQILIKRRSIFLCISEVE